MMHNAQDRMSEIIKIMMLVLLINFSNYTSAQTASAKLPLSVFLQLIDSTDRFEINHSTDFVHVDLPKNMHNTFLSYIKDESAIENPIFKSSIYYSFTLKSGKIINGDIYWNNTSSYIVFMIDGKKYVNSFTKDGVQQLKSLFKL